MYYSILLDNDWIKLFITTASKVIILYLLENKYVRKFKWKKTTILSLTTAAVILAAYVPNEPILADTPS